METAHLPSMEDLPTEVLGLICEQVANQQDFNGLFSCALAGKCMVDPALQWLYRIHNLSPAITFETGLADFTKSTSFQARVSAQQNAFLKWALLWKSIIRSSLRKTAYPYCIYIRTLDLQNLEDLLRDPQFRKLALDTFFADDMAEFMRSGETPPTRELRSHKVEYKPADIGLTLQLVGESITSFVKDSADKYGKAVTLEDISGDVNGTALPIWVSRLSRLKSLTLWNGISLDGNVAAAISQYCPNFEDLTFFSCHGSGGDVDAKVASFFNGLRENTLRSFAALNADAVGPQTLLALNNHRISLKKLRLDGLNSESVRQLSLLGGCDALESLEISDSRGAVNLEETENDIYLEVIAWLGRCNQLRELIMKKFVSGPSILAEVCLQNNIRLRKLHVGGYSLVDNQDFHKALSHQTNLVSLQLGADPEDAFRDDIQTLVSAIHGLTQLKYLHLADETSNLFGTYDIHSLCFQLEDLEEFSFAGYDIADDLWHGLTHLHHLRALNIHALSSFTFDGILDFISTLQNTNRGLALSIENQMAEHRFSDVEEEILRQSIATKVGGRFEITLFRDPESESDFSD